MAADVEEQRFEMTFITLCSQRQGELSNWRDRPGRKPLVLRGAHQVGKI